MAQPIPMALPARDPRLVLQSRLKDAPLEHAEAILAGYEVLQGLHERGVLELLRGALGSSAEVLEIAVDAAQSPQSIRGMRNLLLLVNMLAEINPDELKAVTQAVPEALKIVALHPKPPGLLRLARDLLWNPNARRGLSVLNALLEKLGNKLAMTSDAR